MHHIIYLSSSVTLFSDSELKELLVRAREFNLKSNITGVLFYNDGSFLQAIEGDKKDVYALYEIIKKDKRHKNILTLFDENIDEREYPEWSMAYPDSTLKDNVIPEGYNDLLNRTCTKADLDNYSLKVKTFMRHFIN